MTLHASSEPIIDTHGNPSDVSISDAETQSGNEHEPSDNINEDVHDEAQPSNDNDVEIEPAVDLDNKQSKNQRYDKRDFVARNHGKEREPWCRRPGYGGIQSCLPAAHYVAPSTAWYGSASAPTSQDPREGPSLARRTTPRPPRGSASLGWLPRGGDFHARFTHEAQLT